MINIRNFLGLGYYTSSLDEFLSEFDKRNPDLSDSQRKEIEIYTRIFLLRDSSIRPRAENALWNEF